MPLLIALLPLALPACETEEVIDAGNVTVQLLFPSEQTLHGWHVETMAVSVEGPHIIPPMVETFEVDEGYATIPKIPYGQDRRIVVVGYRSSGGGLLPVARGASSRFSVSQGDHVTIPVMMGRVEQFLPTTRMDTLQPTTMATARVGHTITALPGGRVLVAGGAQMDSITGEIQHIYNSLEIYDAHTGVWTQLPLTLGQGRAFHTATRLKGRQGLVLLAGGISQIQRSAALVELQSLKTAEVFIPAGANNDHQLSHVNLMNAARAHHSATLLDDGSVLLTGGINQLGESISFLRSADRFYYTGAPCFDSTRPAVFCAAGAMETSRAYHSSALLGTTRAVIAGGINEQGYTAAAEAFIPNDDSPETGRFRTIGALSSPRARFSMVSIPGASLLAVGGQGPPAEPGEDPVLLDNLEWLNPNSLEFQSLGAPTQIFKRLEPATVVLEGGNVLVSGGLGPDGASLASAFVVPRSLLEQPPDSSSGSNTHYHWNTEPMLSPRAGHGMAVLDSGNVLVAGGAHIQEGAAPQLLNSSELFVPAPPSPQ